MKFQFLKDLKYQQEAIQAVVEVFDTGRNLEKGIESDFELKSSNEIQVVSNNLEIEKKRILENIKSIQERNNLCERDENTKEITGYLIDENNFTDISIEMETGTGKTYVYLRTIFELNRKYNLRKFIILVPSVAIREGVLKSIEQMRDHFKSLYELNFKGFAYDSNKLNEVKDFVQSNNLIIMIMTVQSFSKDTNVMRQSPDRFNGNRPIDLVASTNPVIIMDEPQNMESNLAKEAIKDLNPLFRLRYSATHKEIYNLVYRLTPIDAYRNNLVKKIEIYGIVEENNNDLLIKVKEIITQRGSNPKAKILLTSKNRDNTYTDKEIPIKVGDHLLVKTNNEAYKGLVVFDINAREKRIELSNHNFYKLEEENQNKEEIFRVQIRETIKIHLDKQKKLKDQNIKVLSLFFIDKVDNYIHKDSFIRRIFNEEFDKLKASYQEFRDLDSTNVHKGYFASKKVRGQVEYVDSREKSTEADKEAFDLIMRDKERLLSFNEKVSFIFSHSALKEGWDNPNIFQICTLRETNSVMKKRQEIGRGLRLPVNQEGVRIYDENINILTVIPNESYRDFVATYQSEMNEDGYKHIEPIDARKKIIMRTNKNIDSEVFRELWKKISQKTKYSLEINSNKIIEGSAKRINELDLAKPVIKIESGLIYFGSNNNINTANTGSSIGGFSDHRVTINNFIERIARETNLTKKTIFDIFSKLDNIEIIFENYEDYIRNIILIILDEKRNLLLNDGLKYIPTGDFYEARSLYKNFQEISSKNSIEAKNSVTDHIECDSNGEREFAEHLDNHPKVKIFTKLPRKFIVETPFGGYVPDWAIVFDSKEGEKLYLVRETKFYDGNLEDFLKREEKEKIASAKKHFESINVDYKVSKDKDLNDLI